MFNISISLADNLAIQGKKQNVERDAFLTKADMKAFNENYLPDVFIAVCYEDGKIYLFNRSNTVDSVTGKWREFKCDAEIATQTDLGVVYVPANGGIKVAADGAISIDAARVPISETVTHPDGTTTVTTTIGGVPVSSTYNPDGSLSNSQIGDSVVAGAAVTTTTTPGTDPSGNPTVTVTTVTRTPAGTTTETATTTTGTDPSGNPFTTVDTTTTTPSGSNRVITTSTTDGTTGNITTSTTTGTNGPGLGYAQTTTTTTDPTGTPIGDTTLDTDITMDGDSIYLTKPEVDDLFADLEW